MLGQVRYYHVKFFLSWSMYELFKLFTIASIHITSLVIHKGYVFHFCPGVLSLISLSHTAYFTFVIGSKRAQDILLFPSFLQWWSLLLYWGISRFTSAWWPKKSVFQHSFPSDFMFGLLHNCLCMSLKTIKKLSLKLYLSDGNYIYQMVSFLPESCFSESQFLVCFHIWLQGSPAFFQLLKWLSK